jgi:hypothetical protein
VRPVSGSNYAQRGALGFATGASDHSRDRRVRSRTQESSVEESLIGRDARLVSHDQTRPVNKVTLWNLSGLRLDAGTVASGRGVKRVRSHVT